ncbi:MAG TPA: hypothetical protein VGU71_14760 [Candidatus Dormibacteraeota bacterium]|nr:hypothetical protein [Candidatus Dormibacteraeota bacterium]
MQSDELAKRPREQPVKPTAVVGALAALVMTACGQSLDSEYAAAAAADAGRYGTWAWNGSSWSRLGPVPDGFTGGYAVLRYWKDFGGLIATAATGWGATKWNGVSWVAAEAFPSPPPYEDASPSSATHWPSSALFLDEANSRLVVIDSNAKTIRAWSGGAWVLIVSPKDWPKRWPNGTKIGNVTYDPYRRELLILSSGDTSKTWALKGSSLVELSDWPGQGWSCSLVPDGADHMLAFCSRGVYSWDGKDWSKLDSVTDYCPKSSVHIASVTMAYDVAHKQLIAVGSDGSGRFHSWHWQQGNWQHLSTKSAPPGTGDISNLVYDPELPGLVLTDTFFDSHGVRPYFFYQCY